MLLNVFVFRDISQGWRTLLLSNLYPRPHLAPPVASLSGAASVSLHRRRLSWRRAIRPSVSRSVLIGRPRLHMPRCSSLLTGRLMQFIVIHVISMQTFTRSALWMLNRLTETILPGLPVRWKTVSTLLLGLRWWELLPLLRAVLVGPVVCCFHQSRMDAWSPLPLRN